MILMIAYVINAMSHTYDNIPIWMQVEITCSTMCTTFYVRTSIIKMILQRHGILKYTCNACGISTIHNWGVLITLQSP